MNPIWALFFKDRFRTPFSVYKMSLAEVLVLITMTIGFGVGVAKGIDWIVNLELADTSILEKE